MSKFDDDIKRERKELRRFIEDVEERLKKRRGDANEGIDGIVDKSADKDNGTEQTSRRSKKEQRKETRKKRKKRGEKRGDNRRRI